MAARTKTKVSPEYKTKYRVKSWAVYDVALRACGDLTVWFDEEAFGAWNAPPNGRPGGTAPVLRPGDREYLDLEDRVPPGPPADRRLRRFAGRLRAQHCEAQKRETLIAVKVINRMTALGVCRNQRRLWRDGECQTGSIKSAPREPCNDALRLRQILFAALRRSEKISRRTR